MKGLFVGARVRIKWSVSWPELAGQEGRIVAASEGGVTGQSEWVVAPDCWGTARAPRRGLQGANQFAPNSKQLEPILPEGQQPGNMSYQELMDSLSPRRKDLEPAR